LRMSVARKPHCGALSIPHCKRLSAFPPSSSDFKLMPRGGRRSTSFKPGKSGNPSGKPKDPAKLAKRQAIADIRAAAKELSPEALGALQDCLADGRAPWAARVGAAQAILDRGWGKAPTTIAGDPENPIEHRVTFTDAERLGALRAFLAKAKG
jgi:hypothetical protein